MERYLTSLYLSLLTYKAGSSNSSYFRVRDHLEEGLTERKCSSASLLLLFQFSSVASDSLQPHRLQQARPPYPSPTPGACSNSCPSSQWCHPTILSSVIPFSSCLRFFPASESSPMNQFFASGGQSIRASASVLPRNIQGWFPLELTGLISLQSKGLLRVFSSIIIQKHQFLRAQPSYSPTFISIHEFCKNYSFDCANICQQRDVSAF